MIPSAVLDVDLDAIVFNYAYVRAIAGPSTEVAAVIKSDAYGLGLIHVGKALEEAGCRHFFVASLDEAMSLRAAGLRAAVVVFNDDLKTSRTAYDENDLIAVINDLHDLEVVSGRSHRFPFFLNVETGFSRFGLPSEDLLRLRASPSFDGDRLYGLFSHLACSDNPQDLTNGRQRDRFLAATLPFPGARRSLSASAGLWLDRSYHFDIARAGSALYGLNNAKIYPNPLRAVARLRAPIVDVRDVALREAIGYGATFRTRRQTSLGVLGIGYRHGLPWACANKLSVAIDGFIAPVVGRISMEYTTIDLTDVPQQLRQQGQLVDFLYDEFGLDELAACAGVNAQEVITRLGASCPRRYLHGGVRWDPEKRLCLPGNGIYRLGARAS